MSVITEQIETVRVMAVEGVPAGVSVMITYKGGNNTITHMSVQEVVRQFGAYLTAVDRQRLTTVPVHKHCQKHTHKHWSCAIM